MDAEFGNPFTDGTFAEEARIAAEVEMKARAAEIEMEALARAVGEVAASKMAKDMAMDSLSLMTVKELGRWERFLDAERREMKTSLEALRKGDPVKAFIHKRRQLVNMHLAKAAREKMEAVEKTRKDLSSYYTSKGRRDKIAKDYLEKIEAILDGYELRVSKQAPGVQKDRLSAKAYVAQMIADGRESEVAPEAMLLAELAPLDVRQLFITHKELFYALYATWSDRKRSYVADFLAREYQVDKAGARAALFGPEPGMEDSQRPDPRPAPQPARSLVDLVGPWGAVRKGRR
jgi:hypothetical protein